MSNRNGVVGITSVLSNLDNLSKAHVEAVFDSLKSACIIAAKEMGQDAPKGKTGRIRRAFVAREAKKLSKQAGVRVLKVGLLNMTFYRTLAKGRKAYKRQTDQGVHYRVSGSPASHPQWRPADRTRYEQRVLYMTKVILRQKRIAIRRKGVSA